MVDELKDGKKQPAGKQLQGMAAGIKKTDKMFKFLKKS